MLVKTKGIVISFIKYRETSIIAKIFTEHLGLQSYIVNGVRKQSNKSSIALYQPLSIVDLVVYHKPNTSLHRISEIKNSFPFQSIHLNVQKMAISIFLTEVISKTISENESHEELFEFVYDAIRTLDCAESNYENHHLLFLIKLSEFLGFKISSINDILLIRGNYGEHRTSELYNLIEQLIHGNWDIELKLTNTMRREILEKLINFYHYHFENIGEFKSLKVLQEMNK